MHIPHPPHLNAEGQRARSLIETAAASHCPQRLTIFNLGGLFYYRRHVLMLRVGVKDAQRCRPAPPHNKWLWSQFLQKQGLLFNSSSYSPWMMKPREEQQHCGINIHQGPQRIRYPAAAGWPCGGKPCENKVPPKVLALILHCINVSRITDANYTQKQSFWVLTLKKKKEKTVSDEALAESEPLFKIKLQSLYCAARLFISEVF